MSTVVNCPTCGAKAKVRDKAGEKSYTGLKHEDLGKKIVQLKAGMKKMKEKVDRLETELAKYQNV